MSLEVLPKSLTGYIGSTRKPSEKSKHENPNPLTKKENKTIYMRMIDPTGNVVSDMATGSGAFSFGGKETIYTAKQTILYSNSGQTIEYIYNRGANYEKGAYKIELYADGFRIGQTSFNIK